MVILQYFYLPVALSHARALFMVSVWVSNWGCEAAPNPIPVALVCAGKNVLQNTHHISEFGLHESWWRYLQLQWGAQKSIFYLHVHWFSETGPYSTHVPHSYPLVLKPTQVCQWQSCSSYTVDQLMFTAINVRVLANQSISPAINVCDLGSQ